MLETIREFALEQLGEADELDAVARRHFDFYAELAESAHLSSEAQSLGPRFALVAPDADNLRAAIDWAAGLGEVEDAVSLAVALESFWVVANPHEGARRMTVLLEHEEALPRLLRGRAIRVRGGTIYIAGDYEEGVREIERALAIFRAMDDDARVGHLLMRLAVDAWRLGELQRARALAEESRALSDGSPVAEAQILYVLGDVAFAEGRGDEALELHARSAELARQVGFDWWEGAALLHQGEYALRLERFDDAAGPVRGVVAIARRTGDRQHGAYGLALSAWLATARGRLEVAGRLWGALDAETARAPVGQWEAERDEYEALVVRDDPAFERGRASGRRLTFDQAMDEALAQPD
jgi:tetratricopeptide (TPR) repeat protein